MPSPQFPRFNPGDPPSAAWLNALAKQVEGYANIDAPGGSLMGSSGTGGFSVQDVRQGSFLARLTTGAGPANSNGKFPYGWIREVSTLGGMNQDAGDVIQGTQTQTPAFEVNNSRVVPSGTLVRMWFSDDMTEARFAEQSKGFIAIITAAGPPNIDGNFPYSWTQLNSVSGGINNPTSISGVLNGYEINNNPSVEVGQEVWMWFSDNGTETRFAVSVPTTSQLTNVLPYLPNTGGQPLTALRVQINTQNFVPPTLGKPISISPNFTLRSGQYVVFMPVGIQCIFNAGTQFISGCVISVYLQQQNPPNPVSVVVDSGIHVLCPPISPLPEDSLLRNYYDFKTHSFFMSASSGVEYNWVVLVNMFGASDKMDSLLINSLNPYAATTGNAATKSIFMQQLVYSVTDI